MILFPQRSNFLQDFIYFYCPCHFRLHLATPGYPKYILNVFIYIDFFKSHPSFNFNLFSSFLWDYELSKILTHQVKWMTVDWLTEKGILDQFIMQLYLFWMSTSFSCVFIGLCSILLCSHFPLEMFAASDCIYCRATGLNPLAISQPFSSECWGRETAGQEWISHDFSHTLSPAVGRGGQRFTAVCRPAIHNHRYLCCREYMEKL